MVISAGLRRGMVSYLLLCALSVMILVSNTAYASMLDKDVAVPQGNLSQTLNTLAAQQGIAITVDPALTQNIKTPAVNGHYSIEQSLKLLLDGSGLSAVRLADGSYVLRKAATGSTLTTAQNTNKAASGTNKTITVVASEEDTSAIDESWKPNDNYTVRSARSAAMLDLAPKHTPQSITSITQQQIQDQGMLTLGEVMEYTPGMTIIQPGVNGASNVLIYARTFPVRSITMDGVIGSTFLLSGMANGDLSMVDPFLYERIDIVRGANGLTSGSGDPSASLAFIRKHPYLQRHFSIAAKTGSHRLRRVELDFSTPVNDIWSTRFAMAAEGGSSWVDRVRYNNLALSWINDIHLTANDTLSAGATYYDFTVHGASPHGITRYSEVYDNRPLNHRDPMVDPDLTIADYITDTEPVRQNFNNATPWSRTNRNYRNLFATLTHIFNNNWEAKLSYNYADNADNVLYGEIGSRWFLPGLRDTADYSQRHDDRRNMVHTLDINLRGSFQLLQKDQDFIIGYDYFDTKVNVYFNRFQLWDPNSDRHAAMWYWDRRCEYGWYTKIHGECKPSPGGISVQKWNNGYWPAIDNYPGSKPAAIGKTAWHQVEQGAYFNTHWRLIPRTHLLLGGRLPIFQSKKTLYSGALAYENSLDDEASKAFRSGFTLHPGFLPYAAVIFDITDDITAYYSYTTAYSHDNTGFTYLNPATYQPMKAQTYTSKEVGMKAGFFGDRLNLSASLFDILQHHFPFVSWKNRTSTEGVDGYRARGYELTAAGEITPAWRINVGYVRQFQDFVSDTNMNTFNLSIDDNTGKYRAPEKTFKLFTSYAATRQLTLGFGWRYQSGVKSTDWDLFLLGTGGSFHRTYQPAYSVYEAMAHWQFTKQLSAQLNVKNIFNKTYYTHERSYISGEPRSVMFTVLYKM